MLYFCVLNEGTPNVYPGAIIVMPESHNID